MEGRTMGLKIIE